MEQVIEMLYNVWVQYFNFIRNWNVIGNISMFDLVIAVMVIGSLIPILFNVIGSSSWLQNKTTIERRERSQQEYENRKKGNK